jgi:hypothetical protein
MISASPQGLVRWTKLRHLDSNQEGRINNPLVYPLTDTGMRVPRFAVCYRPGHTVSLRGGDGTRTRSLLIMSQAR